MDFELEWDDPPSFLKDELERFERIYFDELRSAAQDIAHEIEGDARRNAPVGETGNLQNSIESDVEDLLIQVGSNVEYAPFQEFGTVKMAAQPYLRPAFEENQEYIENRLEEAWNTAVRRVS